MTRAPSKPVVVTGKLFDREPPSAIEAEMSVLGAMLLDHSVVGDVAEIVRGPEAFFVEAHGVIYAAIVELYDRTSGLDLVQLTNALRTKGVLENVGNTEYLVRLAEGVPSAASATHYAKIVADKARLRALIDASAQTIHDCYHAGEDATGVADAAEARLLAAVAVSDNATGRNLGESMNAVLRQAEADASERRGIPTGLGDLDAMTQGLQPGEMVIIAARPSMGKSALAFTMIENIAVRAGRRVALFSMEMGKESVGMRLLSSVSGVDGETLRRGGVPDRTLRTLIAAAQEIQQATIVVDDMPNMSIVTLRSRARKYWRKHAIEVVFIDYLQLMTAQQSRSDGRQQEVSAISRGVKALARELGVPVVCLSQLNRASESREGNRPRMSDLRESGSIEQDADVVLLLHREEYYHADNPTWAQMNPEKQGLAEVIVAKQRNGPTGTVRLTWIPKQAKFVNRAPESTWSEQTPSHGWPAP